MITRQVPAPREEKETTMARTSEKKASEKVGAVVPEQASPNGSAGVSPGAAASDAPASDAPAPDAAASDAAKPARKAARPARPKGPAGLTVTLAYAEGEWTLAAQQGSKALAKPYVVRPAEALKIVAMVDVPGVHEAVEQIMSVERAEAEQQAEKLRAELAEIEARLAELRDVG
jgi:hypothetical protein